MKRTPDQNRGGSPHGPGGENEFPHDDQDRFLLVVNDAFKLLYSSEKARQQLSLPKLGERISPKDIVQEGSESLVREGVREALKNQKVQRYKDMQMAAKPESITAELKFEVYPSSTQDMAQVLLEWFPKEDDIKSERQMLIAAANSVEKMNASLSELEESVARLEAEKAALIRERDKLRIFAMSVSHDLRSPLMICRYSIELMGQYNNEEQKDGAYRDGSRAAKRFESLLNLLDELIYDEKVREGRSKEEDIETVMKTVLFLLELDVNHCNACVKFDFKDVSTIRFPKAFLTIILHNLLSNSCKYRDPGRPLKVRVSTEKVGDEVLLKVKDNGIGMSEEVINAYLFQPFVRPSQKQPGRGLGLHIVRSVVEQSGGRIEVESVLGEGSTFHLWLKPYLPISNKKK